MGVLVKLSLPESTTAKNNEHSRILIKNIFRFVSLRVYIENYDYPFPFKNVKMKRNILLF